LLLKIACYSHELDINSLCGQFWGRAALAPAILHRIRALQFFYEFNKFLLSRVGCRVSASFLPVSAAVKGAVCDFTAYRCIPWGAGTIKLKVSETGSARLPQGGVWLDWES
jgi:hypothetical protein